MRKPLLLILILTAFSLAMAQSPAISNHWLIQFSPIENQRILPMRQVLKSLPHANIKAIDVEFGLLESVATETELHAFLLQFSLAGYSAKVQVRHELSRRSSTPNDSLFSEQKFFSVIQMPRCWDYGRGGIDRNGDTLVVAVVDDGMDTSHPDLIENRWVNRSEIPWNGKDDDGNGYTDDYWGWNGGDSSALVFNSESLLYGHGTAVSGVLGARGNNKIGISGINWDIKLMPLLCYSTNGSSGEVGVIRCMLYAFRQKKLWIKSKGIQGANIVALNMSVGIDNTFPNATPIWCSLFDSLGSVGIVSAGAVTNSNIDIEVNGDIPGLCTSNALIVVANANIDKQRVGSGYGNISVDISAPAEPVYTLMPYASNRSLPYHFQSGTSFAAPQVSGTIAWIYNVVCKSYLSLIKSNPDSAIQLLRNWILSSAEKNASFSKKTVSEGVLQSYGTWQKMDSWCSSVEPNYAVETLESHIRPIVFPNPFLGNAFTIGYPISVVVDWVIYDGGGRVIMQGESPTNELIHLPFTLPMGVFILKTQGFGQDSKQVLLVVSG